MENLVRNPILFRFFLLQKLPLAFLAGLRVKRYDEQACEVSLRYSYLTKNPFKSIYFAALAMAAEMSTGLPALLLIRKSNVAVSMLVTQLTARYSKKARGRIFFRFEDITAMDARIQKTAQTGEGVSFTAISRGFDEQGDEVAVFEIEWSFKRYSR